MFYLALYLEDFVLALWELEHFLLKNYLFKLYVHYFRIITHTQLHKYCCNIMKYLIEVVTVSVPAIAYDIVHKIIIASLFKFVIKRPIQDLIERKLVKTNHYFAYLYVNHTQL